MRICDSNLKGQNLVVAEIWPLLREPVNLSRLTTLEWLKTLGGKLPAPQTSDQSKFRDFDRSEAGLFISIKHYDSKTISVSSIHC